jgi:hypothetical protein
MSLNRCTGNTTTLLIYYVLIYCLSLNAVAYKYWNDCELNEEDYGEYWTSILDILLRGSNIKLKRYVILVKELD